MDGLIFFGCVVIAFLSFLYSVLSITGGNKDSVEYTTTVKGRGTTGSTVAQGIAYKHLDTISGKGNTQ